MPRCSFNARDFAVFLECVKVTSLKKGWNKQKTYTCVCVCVQVKTTFT